MVTSRNATNDRRANTSKAKNPPKKKVNPDARELTNDFATSSDLYGKLFDTTPLTRIDDTRSTETQNLLNLRLAYADPNSASFAGRRSSDMTDILSRMKNGLEGYTAPEMNAFREKSQRGMDSNLAGSLQKMQRAQQNSGVRGAASMAQQSQAIRDDKVSRDNLDQDQFYKNADEKRSRLSEYQGVLGGAEQSEYSRGREARGDYESTLNTDTADRFTKQQFNSGQERADRAQDAAGKLGVMGILQTMKDRKRQNALMKESIKKGIGGPAQASGPSPYQQYADALNGLINNMSGGNTSGATA